MCVCVCVCVFCPNSCLQASRHCGCDLTYKKYGEEHRNKFQQRSSRLNSRDNSASGAIALDLENGATPAVHLEKDDKSWGWGGCGDNWEAGKV